MPKLKKDQLARLTEEAVKVAGTAMSLLVVSRCPVLKEYQMVESFVDTVETVRAALGLPHITTEDVVHGSTKVNRNPIGFELPEGRAA